MARVTVEDCLEHVENRLQLVLIAAKRARQLANGEKPLVDWDNDKAPVVALREIADGFVDISILTTGKPKITNETLEDTTAENDNTVN